MPCTYLCVIYNPDSKKSCDTHKYKQDAIISNQQRFYKVFPGLTGPFKEAPSVPYHNHNKPVYLWNVPKVFFEQSTTFLVVCCPFPSLFETYCWHQIRNKHIFTKLHEVDEVKQLNITHSFPISLESGLYNGIVIIGGTSRLLLWHTWRH